jgi:hypothetical protein
VDHSQPSRLSKLEGFALVPKRLAVFVLTIVAIYVLVESPFDGLGYFGLIWRGKALESKFWHDAIFYLLEDQAKYVVIFILGVFGIALGLFAIRTKFLPFVDKHWLWICMGSIAAIASATVLDYGYNVHAYEALEYYPRRLAALSELQRSISPVFVMPEPPIDFEYVDEETIGRMYSQLGPSLVEEKRTIAATGSEGAKAELGGDIAKLEGHAERGHKTESVQERVKFSTDRKCIELMHYTFDHHSLQTYSDDIGWTRNRIQNDLIQTMTEDAELLRPDAPITRRALQRLRIEEPWPTTVADVERQGQKHVEELRAKLESELTDLKGLVLITGAFTVKVGKGRSLVLSHEFSTKPRNIVFEVTAPSSPRMSELVHRRKLSLTVFGIATTSLTEDGKIAIRAVAIY